MFVTFYSYKGGVGRSMALANVADALARRGLAVLMIDFDLEAPGLEQFFQINQASARRNRGLLDLLVGYKRSMSVAAAEDQGDGDFRDVRAFIVPVYEKLPGGGRLDLLPAGRREGAGQLEEYAFKLRTFDWQDFYFNWEGELFFEWLRSALVPATPASTGAGYDLVLVDSRTGVTEMGGICAYQLADTIIMLCAANHQNVEGTRHVAADFLSPRVIALRHSRPLSLVVVPARVEQRDPALLDRFLQLVDVEFRSTFPTRLAEAGLSFRELTIPYEPQYAFEERVLTIPSRAEERETIATAFYRIADAITLLAEPGSRAASLAPGVGPAAPPPSAPARAQYDVATRFAGYDVYLVCAGEDRALGQVAADRLRAAGLTVFVDAAEFAVGEDWRARTETALLHSRRCLLCIGSGGTLLGHGPLLEAVGSMRATRDLAIVPVLLPGAHADTSRWPPWLAERQPLDLRESYDALDALVPAPSPAPSSTATVDLGAPYPGPRPFTEREAPFFNGRDALIEELTGKRHILLTGPSGTGKTSLVFAGLVPKLRAAALANGQRVSVTVVDAASTALQAVRIGPAALAAPALLLVDHVERWLRTAAAGEADDESLRGWLQSALTQPDLTVVIASRDETVAGHVPASDLAVVRIDALAGDALRAAIERPAERVGLAFEPGLVDRILKDIDAPPVNLAALESLLLALWERRREGFLTNAGYDAALRDVAEQTARAADAALASLDPVSREVARKAVLRLIWVGDEGQIEGRREKLSECVVPGTTIQQVRQALAAFVDRGLLIGGTEKGELVVEPTRELLRSWQPLSDWIAHDRDFLRWRNRVRAYRADWERGGRDDGALLSGSVLKHALTWAATRGGDLTVPEQDYIRRSRQHRRALRIARAVAVMVLLAIAGYIAWEQRQDAIDRRRQRERAQTVAEANEAFSAGQAAAARDDLRSALEQYAKALAKTPDDMNIRLKRGQTADQLGQYDLAIADVSQVLAREPRNAEAWLSRGIARFHKKDLVGALADLDRSIALDPKNPVAFFNRAVVYEQQERAGGPSGTVPGSSPGRPAPMPATALALSDYSRAIALDRGFADALFNRGLLYQQLGRSSEAAKDFTALLNMDVDPQTKMAASTRLAQLGVGPPPKPAVELARPRILIHFGDAADAAVMDRIAERLRTRSFVVPGVERREVRSTGDIRYFFKEDEKTAINAQQVVETALADAGFNLRLQVRYIARQPITSPLRGAQNPAEARQGTIEAWIPSLTSRLAVQQSLQYKK